MPASWTQNYYHLVFSTKHREPWLTPELETRLHPFLGGISKDLGCTPIRINGWFEHVHCLVRYPADLSHSELAKNLKARSTSWVHEEFPSLSRFCWQPGYGGFTVSRSMVDRVAQYIENQKEHHARVSFIDEFMELLRRHEIQATVDEVLDGGVRPPSGR